MFKKSKLQKNTALEKYNNLISEYYSEKRMPGGVKKVSTGIEGLDQVLEGGFPQNGTVLVSGSAGSGKTILLCDFIIKGIEKYNENGVFVTFDESEKDLIQNMKNFGWKLDKLQKQGKLAITDLTPGEDEVTVTSGDYDWSGGTMIRIKEAIKKTKAKRLVIDGLSMIFSEHPYLLENKRARREIHKFLESLKKLGVTIILSSEKSSVNNEVNEIEKFACSTVIEMVCESGENRVNRYLEIIKMRGAGYRSGKVDYEINGTGIKFFPKIPVDTRFAKTDFSHRLKFGIKKLDDMLSGGIPQGHMMLIGGNTGAGKTTLGMNFIVEGIKNNEKVVWVAMEESIEQIKKTALYHGWDFDKYEKQGKLKFVHTSLIDTSTNDLLFSILNTVISLGATRVIFDSVSSLESVAMSKEKVRELLIQLTGFFKSIGCTCLLNYLTSTMFGDGNNTLGSLSTNEMRLSSIVDGVIILRYFENKNEVKKVVTVIKLRGSQHDKGIYLYDIDKGGMKLAEKLSDKY